MRVPIMLNYHNQHENLAPDTSELKDSRTRMVALGFLAPLVILAVIITNLATGQVVILNDHPDALLTYFPVGWIFAGVVAIKLGFAVALFAWYGLANLEPVEHYALPTVLAAIVIIGLGALTCIVSVLV